MADSSVTVTKSSNFDGPSREKFRSLAILSDDADGSVPDQDLYGLDDCVLTEIMYDPDDTATPTGTVEIKIIEKSQTDRVVYLSGSIAADAFSRIMTTGYTGNWPNIEGDLTVKFVDPSDHVSACNIGNAKEGIFKFRFNKKS